jgi:hypothetical protein
VALPLGVTLAPIIRPQARALSVIGRITSPLAVESDSYLGGFAAGNRFVYRDAMQFVWWTPDVMPAVGAFSNAFSAAFDKGA